MQGTVATVPCIININNMNIRNIRKFISILFVTFVTISFLNGQGTVSLPTGKNLAIVATPSGSARYGTIMTSLNDGLIPNNTGPMRMQGNRPPQRLTSQWIQYDWIRPVTTKEIQVFW